jgi:DNA-binding FadR family transcriptional regulator
MLEIGMADALFRNINSQHITELKEMVLSYEVNHKPKTKIKHEISFHSYLYKISKNKTLYGFQKYLKIVFDYVLDIESKISLTNMPKTNISHMALVECLETGTADEFRKMMQSHFSPYFTLDIFTKDKTL